MKLTRIVYRALFACAAIMPIAQAHAAPDPNAIIQKADAAVKATLTTSKTYQATLEMTRSAGNQGSMAISIDLKVVPSTGKAFVNVAPVGKGTGQMAAAAAMMAMTIVDDGKTSYLYSPMQGGYVKQAHHKIEVPDVFKLASLKDVNLKYVRSDHVNGKPVHVIEATPKTTPPGTSQSILFFIDQSSNRPVQLTSSSSGTPKTGGPPMKVDMTISVRKEIMNASIPDSAFKFTPPAGAKEVQGGAAGMNPMGRMFGGSKAPGK